MTDDAEAPRKKRRATEYTKHRTKIGIGFEFATRRVKSRNGGMSSIMERRLAIHYKGAMEGDVGSIKAMIRAIKMNIKAATKQGRSYHTAKKEKENSDWATYWEKMDGPRVASRMPEPTNADMALFVLGIAGVGDPKLISLGAPGSAAYMEGLKTLSPTKFEPWFLEKMFERAKAMGRSAAEIQAICNHMERSSSNFSEWHGNKERLLADLMRVRGPGATRFVPGQSGNRSGRPTKVDVDLPYDGFMMKMVEIPAHGKMHKVSRLDALIFKLATMDPLKNRGVAAQITELLMRLYESGWEPKIALPEIIEV